MQTLIHAISSMHVIYNQMMHALTTDNIIIIPTYILYNYIYSLVSSPTFIYQKGLGPEAHCAMYISWPEQLNSHQLELMETGALAALIISGGHTAIYLASTRHVLPTYIKCCSPVLHPVNIPLVDRDN